MLHSGLMLAGGVERRADRICMLLKSGEIEVRGFCYSSIVVAAAWWHSGRCPSRVGALGQALFDEGEE